MSTADPDTSTSVESLRLAALRAYGLTHRQRDPLFDDLAKLAATVCETPLAAINIVDSEHQWALACSGADPTLFELERRGQFCTLAIEAEDLLEVPDAAVLEPPIGNGLVRFYAGVPLRTATGEAVGTLCVMDAAPRALSSSQRSMLKALADIAMRMLDGYRPDRRLGALIERSPLATLFFEPGSWRWLHANDSAAACLGIESGGLGRLEPAAFSDLYEPQQLDRLLGPLLAGEVDSVTAQAQHRPVHAPPFSAEVAFSSTRDGERPVVIAFIRDLSDRQQLERERHERQQFFDLASEIFLILDSDGRVLQANRRLTALIGLPRHAMAGHPAWHFIDEPDRPLAMESLRRCIAGEQVEAHLWFRCADGSRRLVRFDARAPGNGLVYAVGHDITESSAAQQRLRLLEKAFQASANPMIVASIEDSPGGIIQYVNPAFERVTGYATHEALGRNCSFLQGTDRDQPQIEHMRQAMRSRDTCQVTLRNYRKDGTLFHTSVLLSPVADDHGVVTHYVGVQYDVTQLRQQQDQIARLDRIRIMRSAVGELISRASDAAALLQEVCDLTVGLGGLPLAWAGLLDRASQVLSPTAVCGARAGQIRKLAVSQREDGVNGSGIGGRALRSFEPTVCRDIETAEMSPFWRDMALASGIRSVAYLPVVCEGEIKGLFAFYGRTTAAFDEEEVRLLQSVVSNVSLALVSIERARRIDYLASHDPLTGLPNTLALDECRTAASPAALVVLDIERLKMVNDAFGPSAGDQLLRDVAARLLSIGGGDIEVSRLRSGPFVLSCTAFDSPAALKAWVEQTVLRPLTLPFSVGGEQHHVSVRCGVAVASGGGDHSRAALVTQAESALMQAKRRGERIEVYSPQLDADTRRALTIENELRRAVELGQFVLHYQPKLCLQKHEVRGFEALLRWQHPVRGLVAPAHFIGILEDTGLIVDLAPWLVSQALTDAARINEGRASPLRVAVNVSQLQMRRRDFVASVAAQLGSLAPHRCLLDIEITESLLIDDAEAAIDKLRQLREFGVRIAIDDFGTGYSSLSYIARLPFDALKIDQSFVREMTAHGAAIVASIISLARSLKRTSIAEGVETVEQADRLRGLGCDQVQGYLYGRPMALEQAIAWLADHQGSPAASLLRTSSAAEQVPGSR